MRKLNRVRSVLYDINTSSKRSEKLSSSFHPELSRDLGEQFAEHAHQATVIRDQNQRLEGLRSRLKNLRECCRDLSSGIVEKFADRIGAKWIIAMDKCANWVRADYKSTTSPPCSSRPTSSLYCNSIAGTLAAASPLNDITGIDFESLGNSNDLSAQLLGESSTNEEILVYLMVAVEKIHLQLSNCLCNLNQNMNRVFENEMTDFIKGPIRSARLQCEDFLELYSTYQDQLRELNSIVIAAAAERIKATKNPNASPFPLKPAYLKKYNQARNALSQTEQLLEASAQVAFRKYQLISQNIETHILPTAFMKHIRSLKSFFRNGLDLCDQLLSDQKLDELTTLLDSRYQDIQEAVKYSQPFSEPIYTSNESVSNRNSLYENPVEPGQLGSPPAFAPPSPPSSPAKADIEPADLVAEKKNEIYSTSICRNADPNLVLPLVEISSVPQHFLATVSLMTDPDALLLKCLISGSSVGISSKIPPFLSSSAFKHINCALKVLDLTGYLPQVVGNILMKDRSEFFRSQIISLFKKEDVVYSYPLMEAMVNPILIENLLNYAPFQKMETPEPRAGIESLDSFGWIDRLIIKQFFVVHAKPFLQKVVGTLVNDMVAMGEESVVTREQIIELAHKTVRSIVHHRGLLTKHVKFICQMISRDAVRFVDEQSGLLRELTCADLGDVQFKSDLLIILFLFHDLILPAIRHPENWGIVTPLEQGAISTHVLMSHASPNSAVSSKRGTFVGPKYSSSVEALHKHINAVADVIRDMTDLFVCVERDTPNLEDILVTHTIFQEFENPVRDLISWVTKPAPLNGSGPQSPKDALDQWMLSDELTALVEDYLVNCVKDLERPAYEHLVSSWEQIMTWAQSLKAADNERTQTLLSTASATGPESLRLATQRKSGLVKWNSRLSRVINRYSDAGTSDSD